MMNTTNEEISKILSLTTEYLQQYFGDLDQSPILPRENIKKHCELLSPLDIGGMPIEKLLNEFFQTVLPSSVNTASGGYLGYIPGGGLFLSALGDFLCKCTNRYAGVNFLASQLVEMEMIVIKWLASIVGYSPRHCGGVLTSGGSIANLTALVAARDNILREECYHLGTVYGSEQTHHSNWKAAHACGVLSTNIRKVGVNQNCELDSNHLEELIKNDLSIGKRPFLIIGNAGTTDCGAIDNFEELYQLAQKYSLWLHLDAAYGGTFALTRRGKKILQGMELADSITLDPHKGLCLPYGTGALVVKNGDTLKRSFTANASYLPNHDAANEEEFWDFSQRSLELSREARGLRVLLPLKHYGVDKFITMLDDKLDLTQNIYQQLCTLSGPPHNFQVMVPPKLSLFAFRFNFNNDTPNEAVNEYNQRLLEKINQQQRVFLSGTKIVGKYYLRLAALSHRTHEKNLQHFWEDLQFALKRDSSSDF
ncbi:MAG: aminotransferase class V-fold PLP-dependent enzyme [Oligoflexia bacterium]|nr:aminotransferase class V-fold PLP-dependent enzyme [Oligoflexia bacterium]